MTPVEPLPRGARLFQIGPQKTGTTALQAAGAACRVELRAHGVLYPGTAVNHRLPVAALIGKGIGWKSSADGRPTKPPPRWYWTRLVSEIDAHPELTAWFGHEYAAGAKEPVVEEVARTFGDDLHVLVTLRSIAQMLPSIWQETNKSAGNRGTFDKWLKEAFEPGSRIHDIVQTRHDQGALVRRWADVIGPQKVVVVVLDPGDHDFLHYSVEDLLGLPRNLLAEAETLAHAANRSMTVPEIELFRQFNKRFRAEATTWEQYDALAVRGAIARVLGYRTPAQGEARLTMPDWAADLADAQARANADAVAASGVRIIGDVERLAQPAHRRHSGAEDHRKVGAVPVDLAAEAMLGIAAAGLGLDAGFRTGEGADGRTRALARFTSKELLDELYQRGRKKASRTLKRERD